MAEINDRVVHVADYSKDEKFRDHGTVTEFSKWVGPLGFTVDYVHVVWDSRPDLGATKHPDVNIKPCTC